MDPLCNTDRQHGGRQCCFITIVLLRLHTERPTRPTSDGGVGLSVIRTRQTDSVSYVEEMIYIRVTGYHFCNMNGKRRKCIHIYVYIRL